MRVNLLVAIEGIDGSGKGTISKALQEIATESGFSTALMSFPRYGQNPFSETISQYLNGHFGTVDMVHPRLSALLYAGDRYASKGLLLDTLASNDIVICDRYVPSNQAHQAAKLNPEDRPSFLRWLSTIEYGIYGLPRPDLCFFLDVDVELAQRRINQKSQRHQLNLFEDVGAVYTTSKQDIHERDSTYLQRCREVYVSLAADPFLNWESIASHNEDSQPCTPPEITQKIWKKVLSTLES